MNDPLDQQLQAAVMDLKNLLDSKNTNNQTIREPLPSSYKADRPTTRRLDIKSMFTGQGMPPLEEQPSQQPNTPPRVGAYFEATLTFIDTGDGTTGPQDSGNAPPQPPVTNCDGFSVNPTATVVVSGITICPVDMSGYNPNKTFNLSYDGYFPPSGGFQGSCQWSVVDGSNTITLQCWDDGTFDLTVAGFFQYFFTYSLPPSPPGGGVYHYGDTMSNALPACDPTGMNQPGGSGGSATFSFP